MIVTTDIGNILYRDCKAFGIDIVPDGETLTGELKSERIVIHTKKQQPGKYWKKSFAEVNLCVPNLSENEANTIRLNELERKADKLLDDVVSTYDGTTYRYSIESIGAEDVYKRQRREGIMFAGNADRIDEELKEIKEEQVANNDQIGNKGQKNAS